MSPIAKRQERTLREAFLESGRAYVDATDRGQGERLAGLMAAAKLRIAAKNWRRAEREAKETPA